MPTRAWCSGCNSNVILTQDGLCPSGHPKPYLRGLEQVPDGYKLPARSPRPAPAVSMPQSAIAAGYAPAASTMTYGGGSAAIGTVAPPSPAAQLQPTAPANRWDPDIDPVMQERLAREATRVYHDVPWYETWFGIIAVTLFIWPLGLYCLWRSPVPSTNQKWGVTAGVVALIAFNVVRGILQAMAAMSAMPTVQPY